MITREQKIIAGIAILIVSALIAYLTAAAFG
jgi:hypothetical protein